MGRRTRAELQEYNRARVLAAARAEFTERGFRAAKIDNIAERAQLTRGAVYSNFPGKRALYFAVLAEDAERVPEPPQAPAGTADQALRAFAAAWLARQPLATDDQHGSARLGVDLLPEIAADERTQRPFAQLMTLNAILLGLALEGLRPPGAPAGRLVRIAAATLTTLWGASQLAAAGPGFTEPFDMVGACGRLAGLDLDDGWPPPHTPHIITQTRTVDEAWSPPAATNVARGEPARLAGDGVIAILGLHRLAAAEEAVRAAPAGVAVTAVLVTNAPDELAPLARLTIAELRTCLHQAFPPAAWPALQVVCDPAGVVATAAGVPAVSDATEAAVRIRSGRIVARADGYGACHAIASP